MHPVIHDVGMIPLEWRAWASALHTSSFGLTTNEVANCSDLSGLPKSACCTQHHEV